MKKTVEIRSKIQYRIIQKKLYRLNKMFLKSQDKVAYYYEDMNNDVVFSFNENICFYSASSIKILVCLYLYELAASKEIDLNEKLSIEKEDIKQGSGVLKDKTCGQFYSLEELVYYTLKESDNTAYIKLVNYVTKEKLIEFGKRLGAKHTLEGKDLFGITNCFDMRVYWKELYRFTKEEELGKKLKSHLENPSYKIIDIFSENYYRKYGSFDIAYHECGVVEEKNPFFIFIMTQKKKKKNRDRFIRTTARKIYEIHKLLQKYKEKEENNN